MNFSLALKTYLLIATLKLFDLKNLNEVIDVIMNLQFTFHSVCNPAWLLSSLIC
jgi:hypothetical protein